MEHEQILQDEWLATDTRIAFEVKAKALNYLWTLEIYKVCME